MGKSYRHFEHQERTLIYWWRKEQVNLREIGRRLKRSHGSISRELRRTLWCDRHYYPRGAQLIYDNRVQSRAKRYRLKSKMLREYVDQKLARGLTPELIAWRLKHQGAMPSVCHESIYQYIYSVAPQLIIYLPRHHPKR